MKTYHKIFYSNAQSMNEIAADSIDLVVTSPPYPMIQMWDKTFSKMSQKINQVLKQERGMEAFELMHQELDKIWAEVARVVKPGGIVCINIGDATRSIGGVFRLFPSHSHIIEYFINHDFVMLPSIIWRKPTNSPTKFMGSGMLPVGAYVTLEHEYILIFKKHGKRDFTDSEIKQLRQESAFFWEERNQWFSDLWEFPGAIQDLSDKKLRDRSAAYPFELAYRLINMFSIKGDWVLDPFLGTGTTTIAAMVAERNSYGYEQEANLDDIINERINGVIEFGNKIISDRIKKHIKFIQQREESNKKPKYTNEYYSFPVITSQETNIKINLLSEVKRVNDTTYEVLYENMKINELNTE